MEKSTAKTPLTAKNEPIDLILRPKAWREYVGQEKIKRHLLIMLEAAKKRGETCDHLLFYGQAGLGKTTLAHLVAEQLGAKLKVTAGPALEKMADLAGVLTNLEKGDILFIDEIHRLNRMIEEVLYPAMESRKLNIVVGKGPGARTLSLDLPAFTIVGATTRANLISAPLRSRFGASFRLDYYETPDIEAIINRSAGLLGLKIVPEGAAMLARASRATPRVANRLLKRLRDYMEVHSIDCADPATVKKTLDLLEIDERGLELHDRLLLETIINKFKGGPVGVATLAAALNDDRGIVEDVYEPYLLSIGFLKRTQSGRVATEAAYEHLGHDLYEKRSV